MTATKKITLATVKSFIRRNRSSLLISVSSRYDGMQDGVRSTGDNGFSPAIDADSYHSNNHGIQGVWFVGGSRDFCSRFENETHEGYYVGNCCGSFTLAVRR